MPRRVAIPRWHGVELAWIHNYHDRLHDAGLETVDVSDAAQGLQDCEGLLLTGGVDVDPSLYGEFPHMMTQASVPERDALELTLLRAALSRDLPVLAICRGHQLLNVCLGGSLLQHIEQPGHVVEDGNVSSWHPVSVKKGSRLYDILETNQVIVNSRHHQAVTPERLAAGLSITAMSDDGMVEAMEATSQRWVVGVQWHPERLEPEGAGFIADSEKLFGAFAKALNESFKSKRR